jgi:hypothetical protein
MDESKLEDLAEWHAVQARAALDGGRALGSKGRGVFTRLAEFHTDAATLLGRIIRKGGSV